MYHNCSKNSKGYQTLESNPLPHHCICLECYYLRCFHTFTLTIRFQRSLQAPTSQYCEEKFRRSKYRKKVFLFISDPLYERNSPSGIHYTDYTLFHTTLHMSTTIKKFQSMCFSSFICLQNCLQISWLLQRSCY